MDFAFSPRWKRCVGSCRISWTPTWCRAMPSGWRRREAAACRVSFMADLKALAHSEGLWNLFLPGLRDDEPGTRLSNLEYAPLAEIMGRIPWASEVFNCSAPDTGNMELLHLFASPAQRQRWLLPLLAGEIRSAFAMSEPDVASADASNVQTLIRRDGEHYVLNGRKWFISNACHPQCRLLIVMGKSAPDADPHRQQSMLLVPFDTPGVQVLRNIPVLNHVSAEGHAEILLREVRVPRDHLLGAEGGGFMMAQARLGPGHVRRCMRAIGMAELALQLLLERCQDAASSAAIWRSTPISATGSASRGWISSRRACWCSRPPGCWIRWVPGRRVGRSP